MLEVTTVVRAANAVSACESSGRSAYGSRSSSKVSTAVRKALDLLTAQDSDLELEAAQAALGFRLDERGGVSVRLRVRGGVELRLGNPLTDVICRRVFAIGLSGSCLTLCTCTLWT